MILSVDLGKIEVAKSSKGMCSGCRYNFLAYLMKKYK